MNIREKLIVPKCYYPWETVQSPIANAFDDEEKGWFENDYDFISKEGVERCKTQFMSRVATYMNPTCNNIDLMRPCARFMIYITLFDDYFGLTPVDELRPVANRVYQVMLSEDPRPDEIGILRQMAQARKEWLANGMPGYFIKRIAKNFYDFMVYGTIAEIPFKLAKEKKYPSLAHYMNFRQHSIGMFPFGDLIEPATNFAIPVYIYNHPIIQRCKQLLSYLIVIQNDFVSIFKEIETEGEIMNIIFILRNQYQISYQEACTEAMRLHDEYAKELEDLHQSVISFKGFEPYQKEVENYIYHIKLQVSGCENWYHNSGTNRYEQKGFVVPQYGREGDDIIIPQSIFVKE